MPGIETAHNSAKSQDLYGEIADCFDYAALESTLLGPVARSIGAETSTLLHFQRGRKGYNIGHNLAKGVENKVHNQYVSKFHRSDPVILNRQVMPSLYQPTDAVTDVYRLSDVCDPAEFSKSEYYNDFLKPSGIRHVLALMIKPQTIENDLMVVIGFHRPTGSRDFGDRALQMASDIAPIVGSTIARLTFKEHLSQYRLLSENLKTLLQNTGYLILDDALQIQETSTCVSNNLYGDLPFLMHHISSAVQTMRHKRLSQMTLKSDCPDEGRSSLHKNINFEIEHCVSKTGQSRYAVRLGFAHSNIAIARCTQEFGWTARESEIVFALAQGLTNTQISESLKISVRTVENHLRSIYSKANVTSRTQLLRKLLNYTPARPMDFA